MIQQTIHQWKPFQEPACFSFGIQEISQLREAMRKKTGAIQKKFFSLLIFTAVLSATALVVSFLTAYYYVRGDAWIIAEMVLLALAPLLWIATLYLRPQVQRLDQINVLLQSLEELRLSGNKKITLGFNVKTIKAPDHIEYGKKERDCFAFLSLHETGRQQIITLSVSMWSHTLERTRNANTAQQRTVLVNKNQYQLCFHCFRTNEGEQGPMFFDEKKKTVILTSEWIPCCVDQQEMDVSEKSRPAFSVTEWGAFLKRNLGR